MSVRDIFPALAFCNDEKGDGERGGDRAANGDVGLGDNF